MSDIGARFVACRGWRWKDREGCRSRWTNGHRSTGATRRSLGIHRQQHPTHRKTRRRWAVSSRWFGRCGAAPFGQRSALALMDGAWWTFYANKPDGDCAIVGKTEAAATCRFGGSTMNAHGRRIFARKCKRHNITTEIRLEVVGLATSGSR